MKTTVAGKAMILTSSIKTEDIKLLEKYKPAALRIVSEDGKSDIFAIGTGSRPAVCEFGLVFDGTARDDSGCACATFSVPEDVSDVKEWVADKIGIAAGHLMDLEARLPEVITDLKAVRAELINNIALA